MSFFLTPPGLTGLASVALIATSVLALAACGGGTGDDPPDDGSGGVVPKPSIETLSGDWVQTGCVRSGAQSFKRLLRASVAGSGTINYSEGVLTFNSTGCTGASQLVGPSRLGTVTFARSEANQILAAHWGEFRTVTGTRFGAIWTLRPTTLLCLLGDEIPTNQPSLSAVFASLATVPVDNCFVQRNP